MTSWLTICRFTAGFSRLQWLQSDRCRIWLLSLDTSSGDRLCCRLVKACWGSVNKQCPVSKAAHALLCENKGSGIKFNQAGRNYWQQIKDRVWLWRKWCFCFFASHFHHKRTSYPDSEELKIPPSDWPHICYALLWCPLSLQKICITLSKFRHTNVVRFRRWLLTHK